MTKDTNKKEEKIEVSIKERDKFLEELVFNDIATYASSILDGKVEVKFKSLSGDNQLSLDSKVGNIKASPVEVMHIHTIWLLTYTLTAFGPKDLSTLSEEERYNFIKAKSGVIIDLLSDEHNIFHKKLQASIAGDVIEEVFLESPSTS